jgi:uncharacterized integral membrane protein
MRTVEPSNGEEGRLSTTVTPRRVAVVLTLALFVAWCLVNRARVTVDFLVFDAELRLFVALLIAGVLGAVVGFLSANVRRRRRPGGR